MHTRLQTKLEDLRLGTNYNNKRHRQGKLKLPGGHKSNREERQSEKIINHIPALQIAQKKCSKTVHENTP
jgi:hypothetical protein